MNVNSFSGVQWPGADMSKLVGDKEKVTAILSDGKPHQAREIASLTKLPIGRIRRILTELQYFNRARFLGKPTHRRHSGLWVKV